jgi:hypothetical protein
LQNSPKNLRRTKGATQSDGDGKNGPLPAPFQPGAFVREISHPQRWGKLITRAEQSDAWLIQYSTGARMTARDAEIEQFTPTEAEKQKIEAATAFFNRAMERNRSAG